MSTENVTAMPGVTVIRVGQIWRAKMAPKGIGPIDLLRVERIDEVENDVYCRGIITGRGLVMAPALLLKWGTIEKDVKA